MHIILRWCDYHDSVIHYIIPLAIIMCLQTNGLTERFNQTLSRCLAKVVNEDHSNWDEKIDTVLMAYRVSKQASTKHSPYYMLYQKPMQLPIDAELFQHDGEHDEEAEEENVDIDEIIDNLLERRQQAFSKAKENIDAAQRKQKQQYDVKHSSEAFPIGTEVLVENTADKQRKGGKLNRVWFGPYTISKFIGKGVYELSNKKGNVVRNKVNVNRLKRYIRRSDTMDGDYGGENEIDKENGGDIERDGSSEEAVW